MAGRWEGGWEKVTWTETAKGLSWGFGHLWRIRIINVSVWLSLFFSMTRRKMDANRDGANAPTGKGCPRSLGYVDEGRMWRVI